MYQRFILFETEGKKLQYRYSNNRLNMVKVFLMLKSRKDSMLLYKYVYLYRNNRNVGFAPVAPMLV